MPKLTLVAAGVLVLTNLVVLAGVAYNRSGVPVVSIELTERELPITPSFLKPGENSGTTLTLEWNALEFNDAAKDAPQLALFPALFRARTPAWLDTEKLVELGFNIPAIERDIEKHKQQLFLRSIEAILVLEYGGEAWQKAVKFAQTTTETLRHEIDKDPGDASRTKSLEQYESRVERLRTTQSRLYIIDAGLDKRALLDKYADSDRYLFVRGQIGLRWNRDLQQIDGRIREVSHQNIHVPLPFSRIVAELAGAKRSSHWMQTWPTRYRVRLNIGNRLEPWIESVTMIDEKTP